MSRVRSLADDATWWIAATEGLQGPLTQGEVFDSIRLGTTKEGTLIRSGADGPFATAGELFPAGFTAAGRPGVETGQTPDPHGAQSATSSALAEKLNSMQPETRTFVLLSGAGLGVLVVVLLIAVIAAVNSGGGEVRQVEPPSEVEFVLPNPVVPPSPLDWRPDGGYTGPPPPESWSGPNMGGYSGPLPPEPWSGP